jgi:hypothetical protein
MLLAKTITLAMFTVRQSLKLSLLGLALDHNHPTYTSKIAGILGVCHYTWPFNVFFEIGSCYITQHGPNFLFSCVNLPSAGITGVHHQAWL